MTDWIPAIICGVVTFSLLAGWQLVLERRKRREQQAEDNLWLDSMGIGPE